MSLASFFKSVRGRTVTISTDSNYKPTAAQLELRRLIRDKKRILAYGGSRSGKTFEFCRALIVMAVRYGGRYAIFRRFFSAVRTSVFNDTLPKVLEVCFPTLPYEKNKHDAVIRFPHNGSEIWLVGLDDDKRVEKILGREFAAMYFNECSEISYTSIETALTRLAQRVVDPCTNKVMKNRAFFDCNPPGKSHWTYKLFVEHLSPTTNLALSNSDIYGAIQINPDSNVDNLPEDYISSTLTNTSERLKTRFLYGEFAEENTHALWKSEMIDPYRVNEAPKNLERIVIGVDPAVTSNIASDHTGIVVAGMKHADNGIVHFYVLADHSMKGQPSEWARLVQSLYASYCADLIVAETNQGGDLVTHAMYNVNRNLPIKTVHASRGKIVRAEPISILYAQGRVHHVGIFPKLESEMSAYTGDLSDDSPDRMDAMVWALTELSESENLFKQGRYQIG